MRHLAWLEESPSAMAGLIGHPACDKALLFYSLAGNHGRRVASQVLIYFFEDEVDSQRDAKAVLLGLLSQALRHHKTPIQHVWEITQFQTPSVMINVAFVIEPENHSFFANVCRAWQLSMPGKTQGTPAPSVRVWDSKVSLVLQSAKRLLLFGYCAPSRPLGPINNTENAALKTSTLCIYYLLARHSPTDSPAVDNAPVESMGSEEKDANRSSTENVREAQDDETSDLNTDLLFPKERDHPTDQEPYQALAPKHDFYRYASLHWARHFALCERSAPSWLREAAKSLFNLQSGNRQSWLRVYWEHSEADTITDDPFSLSELALAAFFNLHGMVTELLSGEASQDSRDQALFWSSCAGHRRIVDALLDAGADPNAPGPGGQTPLTIAAEHGRLECVAGLLADERTDPSVRGRRGRSALALACSKGHKRIVKALLADRRCAVDDPDQSGATPLFWAVGGGGGHLAIVSLLVRSGAALNHRDHTGRTVVSWAAGDGMSDVLRYLIGLRGIHVNLADENGRSPLSWAAGSGRVDAVDILVRHEEVDQGSVDKDHRNAISWASAGGHAHVLRALIGNGCPGVDEEDVDGWAPLAWAVQTDAPETIEVLLATGQVNLERRDPHGRTALHWAVEYGHVAVVRVLLWAGADPRTTDDSGVTVFGTAARLGKDDILRELRIYMNIMGSKDI
ncbi:ankyrin repeat-containing domain protein [Xylariomycetidae sp. FL2044]|nr:ankyrin repeat-containing domain protein [Xylariomycetidae sp. FL2044]